MYGREMYFECPFITECFEANIALNSFLPGCRGYKRDSDVVTHFLLDLRWNTIIVLDWWAGVFTALKLMRGRLISKEEVT